MNEEDRREFYEYCVQTGFIIRGISKPKDWSENKKYRKLKQYIRKGYRIYIYNEDFGVINIFSKKISKEIEENIREMYLSIRNDALSMTGEEKWKSLKENY